MTIDVVEPVAGGSDLTRQTMRLPDGRTLGYAEFGDPDGAPVLAFHGTPVSRLIFGVADQEARARKLRLIAPDRPGYGLSSPQPKRHIADYPDDIVALADHLGLRNFALIGLSGGGPFAIACAHRLPHRIVLAGLICPVGPLAEVGPSAQMSALQRAVFGAAGRSELAARVLCRALRHLNLRRPDLAYRGLMRRSSPADRGILARPEIRRALIECLNDGLSAGGAGPARDLHLFANSWGLKLDEVLTPCVIWQGTDDRTIPPRAAYALAERLPVCRLDRVPGAGHFSGCSTVSGACSIRSRRRSSHDRPAPHPLCAACA